MNYALSLDNVKGIPFDKYEKDFTFIINGQQFETSRFVADILSPIVRRYHYIDESITTFTVDLTDSHKNKQNVLGTAKHFDEFLRLADFSNESLDEELRSEFKEYFIRLGNIEEYMRLEPSYIEETTPENVIERLHFIIDHIKRVNNLGHEEKNEEIKGIKKGMSDLEGISESLTISELVKFASSHFYELQKDELKTLPIGIIERILEGETLRLEDEDTLLDFIIELYKENDEYSVLFEFVKFEELSEEALCKFIDEFNIEYLNGNIWKSICHRLIPVKKDNSFNTRYSVNGGNIKEFKHDNQNEFSGILRYLTDESGGNIHDNKTIEITSNSILNDNIAYHPKNLVDYQNNNNYYESKSNVQDATICFDFRDKLIQVNSYSIKTFKDGQNGEHLKNWVVEVSNDCKEWEIIDKHENESRLNGPNIIATFNTKETRTYYRYIRLHQTGQSWYNNYYFRFYFIEFYGKLNIQQNNKVKI